MALAEHPHPPRSSPAKGTDERVPATHNISHTPPFGGRRVHEMPSAEVNGDLEKPCGLEHGELWCRVSSCVQLVGTCPSVGAALANIRLEGQGPLHFSGPWSRALLSSRSAREGSGNHQEKKKKKTEKSRVPFFMLYFRLIPQPWEWRKRCISGTAKSTLYIANLALSFFLSFFPHPRVDGRIRRDVSHQENPLIQWP